MGRSQKFQAFKFQLTIPDAARIFYQTVDNGPPDALSSLFRRNIHALDFSRACFKFFQAADSDAITAMRNKVKTPARRMKLVRIRQIGRHHGIHVEFKAVIALYELIQPFQILTNQVAGLLLVLSAGNLKKYDLTLRIFPG